MTHGYDEDYVAGVMENLGDMMDYAIHDLNFSGNEFAELFISSGIAKEIENGNPKFIAGMSGVELAREIIFKSTGRYENQAMVYAMDKSQDYWVGWILAYYQWKVSRPFAKILEAISYDQILALYLTLHEADIEKAVDILEERYQKKLLDKGTALARIRKQRGLSQRELAEKSGVSLRMIQLYEQRQNDIEKAQLDTVLLLAKALKVELTALMDV